MLGVDPHAMTLRELVWMLHARRLHDWGQMGSLLAMTANVNRNPKKRRRPFGIQEFVPSDLRREFRASNGIRLTKTMLHALRPIFDKKEGDANGS